MFFTSGAHCPTVSSSPSNVQLSSFVYTVDEGAQAAAITVTRSGDISAAARVDFTTSDGSASQRSDYITSTGTISFNPNEISKTFTILIVDDLYIEGNETVNISLSNPTGVTLGATSAATLTIIDNDTTPASTNPLDNQDGQFFIRQHYFDFLNRVPDPAGFAFWTNQITNCGSDQTCRRNQQIAASDAFFFELEYQQTAAFVFRLYRAAFGNNQPFPNPDATNPAVSPSQQLEARKLPSYSVFSHDRARLIGSSNLTQDQLALAASFVMRPEFVAVYPATLAGPDLVDALIANIRSSDGVDLASQRSALISQYDLGGPGRVLFSLASDDPQADPINRAFIDAEYNRVFAATEYFGYLRRDPDIGGYLFWVGQVNSAPLRSTAKQHTMVCTFLRSSEYQQRFSPIVTHSDDECSQVSSQGPTDREFDWILPAQ
jgi:hypothetical protein